MSVGCKQVIQYGVAFCFSDISVEELNAFIQKVIPEKTKIAKNMVRKIPKVRKK